MQELVFLKSQNVKEEPFTTSEVIAESTNVAPRSVYLLIEKHLNRLEKFGRVSFQMTPLKTKGGVQKRKVYRLNEQQATFLITLLKNTDIVLAFKQELVRQFYVMREELTKRRMSRQIIKPSTRSMTDAIKENTDPEHLNEFTYSNYIKLAYKAALGMSAKQLKAERGVASDNIVDYMSTSELERVKKIENVITALLDTGLDYQGIKAVLLNLGAPALNGVAI